MFYHFTHIGHLPKILASRRLLPSDSNIGSPIPDLPPYGLNWGPDVVWLLDEATFTSDDPKHHGLYVDNTGGKRRIRFEVDVPAIRWKNWAPALDMNPEWRRALLAQTGGEESAEHFYVWPAPIKDSRWVTIHDMVTDLPVAFDTPSVARA